MRTPPSRSKPPGVTVVETLVTTVVFGFLLVVLFLLFRKGIQAVLTSSARQQAEISLNKAHVWLKRDLEQADPAQIMRKRVSLPGNGDAIWFLSPEDPAETDPDKKFQHSPETGQPLYRTQILYYLIRPLNYQEISGGLPAAIDPNPNGDYYAPHKFLVRKVIDRPVDPEKLLSATEIDEYITPPTDYGWSPFGSESHVVDYRIVSDQLLSFETELDGSVVEVRLSALRIDEARRSASIGSTSFQNHPLTVRRETRMELRN